MTKLCTFALPFVKYFLVGMLICLFKHLFMYITCTTQRQCQLAIRLVSKQCQYCFSTSVEVNTVDCSRHYLLSPYNDLDTCSYTFSEPHKILKEDVEIEVPQSSGTHQNCTAVKVWSWFSHTWLTPKARLLSSIICLRCRLSESVSQSLVFG